MGLVVKGEDDQSDKGSGEEGVSVLGEVQEEFEEDEEEAADVPDDASSTRIHAASSSERGGLKFGRVAFQFAHSIAVGALLSLTLFFLSRSLHF